jgi:phage gpG-like protein
MPGITQQMTFSQFANAARTGALLPGGGAHTPPGGALPAPVGRVVAQLMLSDVKGHIATSTAPNGAAYRPLSHPRPNGGTVPLRDTGVLMGSLHAGSDATSAWVSTTHPGAAVQNFGGTIRGKGKMLAIPLTKEAQRSGGPRRWRHGQLRFQPTGRGRVFLLLGSVPGGQMVGQFLLVDKVVVPARPFMGLSKKAQDQIGRVILEARLSN